MIGGKTPLILVPVLNGGELASACPGSNLEKAAYPYFIMKNETLINDLIKLTSVKIIMLVLLLVTPCASRLTPPPPSLKGETKKNGKGFLLLAKKIN